MTRSAQWLYGWLLLLPAAVLLALFTHYPALATLWHSFHATPKASRAAPWVGLDNYRQLVAPFRGFFRRGRITLISARPCDRQRHNDQGAA